MMSYDKASVNATDGVVGVYCSYLRLPSKRRDGLLLLVEFLSALSFDLALPSSRLLA